MILKKLAAVSLSALMVFSTLTGCGGDKGDSEKIPEVGNLKYESTTELQYATQFAIYNYEGGYKYIEIVDGDKILVVPEGAETPEGLEEDVIVVNQPLENVYMAATSAMSLVNAAGAIDQVKFSSLEADGWYVEEAARAMNEGRIRFAGKYNTPDYEMLVGENCDLAIESTMILHNPEVKEKLEDLGIKVMTERSSYESHPLGRTEWMKLYGALFGKEEEANKAYSEQVSIMDELDGLENTGKTVAFFYINSAGGVVTRKSNDYVATMIEIAGGKYIFENLGDEDSRNSTVNMQMEEFYASAKDADFIFYNSSIVSGVETIDQLIDQNSVLADFKAVKEGNVWCTGKNVYQETDKLGSVIRDMNEIITNGDECPETLDFFFKVK